MRPETKNKALKTAQSALIFFFSAVILHLSGILPVEWMYGIIFFLTVLCYFDPPLSLVFSLWGAGFILFSCSAINTASAISPLSSIPVFYFIFLLFISAAYAALKFEPEIRERLFFPLLLIFVIPAACIADRMFLSKTPLGTLLVAPLFLLLSALFVAPLEAFYAGFFGAVLTAILSRSFCLLSLGMFIGAAQQCDPLLVKNAGTVFHGKDFFALIFTSPLLKTLDAYVKYFFSSFHILFQCAAWGISCYLTSFLSKPSFSGRLLAFSTGSIALLAAFFTSNFLTLKLYPQGANFILLLFAPAFLIFYIEDTIMKKSSRSTADRNPERTQHSQANTPAPKNASGMSRFNLVEPDAADNQTMPQTTTSTPKKLLKQTLEETKSKLRNEPENPELLFILGKTQYNLGEFSGARKTFTKLIALKQDHEEAHTYLSMIQYDEKRSKKN